MLPRQDNTLCDVTCYTVTVHFTKISFGTISNCGKSHGDDIFILFSIDLNSHNNNQINPCSDYYGVLIVYNTVQ